MFAFAYCAQSQQNMFKLFIVTDNFYSLVFPQKNEEFNLFLTINYKQIQDIIYANITEIFKKYDELPRDYNKPTSSSIDQILKKVLLEVNQANKSLQNNHSETKRNSRIVILSDTVDKEDDFDYNQKHLYLLKKAKVYIDCLHLNEGINFNHSISSNTNTISNKLESIAFYSGGIFENIKIKNEDENLTQILLHEFLLYPEERKVKHCNSGSFNTGTISNDTNNVNGNGSNNSNNIINKENKLACDNCKQLENCTFFTPEQNMILCKNCKNKSQ